MKKLSKSAYGGVPGKEYVPYVTDGKKKKSGGTLILIFGIILATLFAASTAYSGMKVGLTVAAGIPGSILGSGLVALFVKNKSVLGKNILAGMSAGGETIASGMIFVLPAIVIIGGQINFWQGILVGIAAVLFSVGGIGLVEDYLLVQEHGNIVYPEAMAISESLVASEVGGDSLKSMGIGFGIGGVLTALTGQVFGVVNNTINYATTGFYKTKVSVEANPMLSGIGFIVGIKVAMTLFAGSVFTNFAVIPLISYFAEMASDSSFVWNDAATLVNQVSVDVIAGSYTKYIGAGMMISGGLIGAIQLIPTIITSIKATMAAKGEGETGDKSSPIGMIALLAGTAMTFIMGVIISDNFAMAIIGAILTLVLGFLFAIVAGRLAGTLGTSNLPVSGMTIASLVIMTAVFFLMGWTDQAANVSLLMFGTIVVTIISVAGSYMQSQKVTMVMGGNSAEVRNYFMIAGIVGVVVVTGIIQLLADKLLPGADGIAEFSAPQANLIATLTDGIMSQQLPWLLIAVGFALGVTFFLLGLPVMSVAVGAYLPMATTSIIVLGALVRVFVEMMSSKDEDLKEERINTGISMSSGLIAGGSIIGLLGIILQVSGVITPGSPSGFLGGNGGAYVLLAVLVVFSIIPMMAKKSKKAAE
ncbi:OPT family oligopeptide transporter [Vagococcus intermedius]|uniref:Oligopeptide transporter, OPT family n=1 Tax=Vagococcus intermedius TaxID=2991418 RepID=A0AAF0CUC4_9ENTE|nr:oligopeptide transporter, OPT family [Vagococcus intermedius]WEG73041.1 oligopeptide transporter, OPT family [Vagococcus intermedius]WEG75126.1 oligopeptide transporter, OPT family [Vagococcus intermedius]